MAPDKHFPAAAQMGDTLTIDFKGSVGGVAFAGGTAENYDLTLGSKSFIPGFEEQLLGAKPGEEKAVKVRFPDDYHAKEMAGKEAMFAVTVKQNKGRGGAADMVGEMAAIEQDMQKLQQLRMGEKQVLSMEHNLHNLELAKEKAQNATAKAERVNSFGSIIGLSVGVGAVVGGAEKMRFLPKMALAALAGGVGGFIGDRITRGGLKRAQAREQQEVQTMHAYKSVLGAELQQMELAQVPRNTGESFADKVAQALPEPAARR